MNALKDGARFLSRGMRGGNAFLTLLGGLLVARGILRWLDGPSEELVYSRALKPGERISVGLARPEA